MIRKCCECNFINGTWKYEEIIGAKVRVRSLPVANRFSGISGSTIYTIEDIIFQVSDDGKTIVIVKLAGTDCLFTFKDLEVISLKPLKKVVCSETTITGRVVVNG